MSLYTVESADPLASAFTKKLSEEDFAAYHEIAEVVLGLTEPALTNESDIARLRIAIMLQINFMSQYGLDPYIKASEGMSSQASSSVVWRDRYIDPRAWAIVKAVTGGAAGWYGAGLGSQSHRTNDTGYGTAYVPPNYERFR
jgi:hypothetical protein